MMNDQTYEMKCSIEVSTSACLSDLRKEDKPGVAAMVVDMMIVQPGRRRKRICLVRLSR